MGKKSNSQYFSNTVIFIPVKVKFLNSISNQVYTSIDLFSQSKNLKANSNKNNPFPHSNHE